MTEKYERGASITLGVISVIAIIAILTLNNFKTESLLESVINFTQVAVPVLGVLIGVAVAKTVSRERKTPLQIGREALSKLQSENPDFLMGPRYNREGYDPEKGKGIEYLFITNDDQKSKLRAKFITVKPLEEGVLAIYVQKGTLVYGLKYNSDQATLDEIKKIQSDVFATVSEHLNREYGGYYEVLPNSNDSTIIVDFDEEKMKEKMFSKAVYECAGKALLTIKKFKR